MNQRLQTFPILVLSIALQLLPLCRQLFVAPAAGGSPLAIIFRWAAGAAVLLGANHAVSGASNTQINSSNSAIATVGKKFNYTITTSGHAAFSWSAANLPTGISLVNNRLTNSTASVSTPVGTYGITLIAYEGTGQSGAQTAPFLLTLNVGNAPAITAHPTNRTVLQGTNVTFAVTTTGTGPFSYQWTLGGNNIPGANTSTLTRTNVQSGDAGTYRVNISTPFGTTNSLATNGVLVVLVPPTIDMESFDVTAAPGDTATFSIAASGSAPLKYQWQFNASPLANRTNAILTLTNIASSNAGFYTCVVTNAAGSVTSAPAALTILGAPTISSQPQDITANEGDATGLSVTAGGQQPLAYQWFFKNAPLPFETDSTIFLNPLATNQAGPYFVVVSNSFGRVTSAVATVTVLSPPRVVTAPSNIVGSIGGNATFNVVASGTGPLSYQWLFNGSNLAGATATSLSLTNLSGANAGPYAVIITNVLGAVTSAPATLTVSAAVPVITGQPQSLSVILGASTNLSVLASSASPLGYQWRLEGTNLAGQTSATLPLNNVTVSNAGNYTVLVTNAAGSVTSAVATVTVLVPPGISQAPQSLTVWSGSNASFAATATGSATLQYQWRFNNGNLPGQTQPTLTLTGVNSNDAGLYQVVVTNVAGSVTSAPAVLTVAEPATLRVLGQTASTVDVGFTAQPGVAYELLCLNALTDTNLITLTNWPASTTATNIIYSDAVTNGLERFYRLRMNIP